MAIFATHDNRIDKRRGHISRVLFGYEEIYYFIFGPPVNSMGAISIAE